jgi:hypothetical protein
MTFRAVDRTQDRAIGFSLVLALARANADQRAVALSIRVLRFSVMIVFDEATRRRPRGRAVGYPSSLEVR